MISKHTGRLQGLTGALALMLAFAAAAAGKIKIHVPELPSAEATAPYPAQTFTAADDDDDAKCCTWTSSGNLDGLTLSSAGVLSGTPTAAGSFPFTVAATDSKSASGTSETLTLTVIAGPGISPASLPAGELGVPYAPTLSGTGGTPGYTFSLTGALPAGVKFNNRTGAFSGTPGPGTAGSYPITVQVTDSVGGNFTQGYTIVIVSPPPVVNPAALPQGEVAVAYSTTLTESGGAGPNLTWSLATGSGPLPAGVSLSPAGVISGTPTQSGSFPFSVQVTDSASMTSAPQAFTLTVIAAPSITTTSPLPAGEVKVRYSQTLTASGGTTPYTWSVTNGSLPAGLSLHPPNGQITGTPGSSGSFNFTATVTDTGGGTASQAFTLNIAASLSITTTSPLPAGEATAPYSQTLTATGGATPYTWTVTGGSLPAGLSLNSTGAITGTPTTTGSSSFTATVTDSGGASAKKGFTLNVVSGPSITITTNATLPKGEAGAAYSQTLIASGGHVPPGYTWSVIGGSLPAGLSLSAGGVLSGTPIAGALGTSSFTVQVTDSANGTATLAMSLTIIAGPTITTAPALPDGSVSVAYTAVTLAASGGTQPYIWSITLGALPPGLSLDANAGTITGIPTAAGASNFTIQVIDAKGVSATKHFSITITAGLTITTAPGLSGASIGRAYSATLSAAGGTPPYTWSVSIGSLPTGLTLNSSTGAITGPPSSAGSFKFTVQVTDSASVTATKQFTLNVAQTLAISTAPTLPSGAVGTPYSVVLSALGGTPPYTFTVISGAPPSGLSLNPGGLISGTPVSTGTSNFTVQVRDSNSVTASQPFNLTVVSGLAITTAPQLPQGAVNSQYSQTIAATGGTAPYTWNLAQGALPPGLSFSVAGVIAGKPSSTGTFTFAIQVADQVGATSTKQFTLTIVAGLTITSLVLPQGTLDQAYGPFTLAQVGGTPPYTWSVSAGSMATGLSLSANGIITGKPTKAGVFNFTLQVKDSIGAAATKAFTISVVPPTVPQVNVAGVPPTSPAGQQISFSLSLTSPYPLDITGEVALSFQPDAVVPAVDPAMQFSSGGTTTGFTIPANSTTAVPIALQTGTVSGTITITFTLAVGGVNLPGFQSTITIPRSSPVIQSVKLVRISAGLEVHVVGFSPSRDLTEADLNFTAAPGATLQTTTVTENLASAATAWYQSAGATQYGSQLMLVLPFTASQGSVDAVGSVSVVLKNAKGSSPATSGTF